MTFQCVMMDVSTVPCAACFLNNSDRDSEDEDDEFEGALSDLLKAAETLKRAVSVLRLSHRRRD